MGISIDLPEFIYTTNTCFIQKNAYLCGKL